MTGSTRRNRRDLFAAHALTGILAAPAENEYPMNIAQYAYILADAMLAESDRRDEEADHA